MDVVLFSRIQFALTTAFHIVFPILTIGLAVFLVVVEWLWLRSKNEIYYRRWRFRVRVFAIHFLEIDSFFPLGCGFDSVRVPGEDFTAIGSFTTK